MLVVFCLLVLFLDSMRRNKMVCIPFEWTGRRTEKQLLVSHTHTQCTYTFREKKRERKDKCPSMLLWPTSSFNDDSLNCSHIMMWNQCCVQYIGIYAVMQLRLIIHRANFWAILPGNFFEQCFLGTFPLRMGNTFLSGYFISVVSPVSHLVAHWWQH